MLLLLELPMPSDWQTKTLVMVSKMDGETHGHTVLTIQLLMIPSWTGSESQQHQNQRSNSMLSVLIGVQDSGQSTSHGTEICPTPPTKTKLMMELMITKLLTSKPQSNNQAWPQPTTEKLTLLSKMPNE